MMYRRIKEIIKFYNVRSAIGSERGKMDGPLQIRDYLSKIIFRRIKKKQRKIESPQKVRKRSLARPTFAGFNFVFFLI